MKIVDKIINSSAALNLSYISASNKGCNQALMASEKKKD